MDSFVHLHNHSSFSELDGAAHVEDYVRVAAQDGQPAIASTDHGNLFALPDYERACAKHGIKFIPGIEAYQAEHSQSDRPARKSKSADADDSATGKLYFHASIYARNQEGYLNLCRLSTNAWLEGYHYKPRCDWGTLEQFSQGLMATSGCLGGITLQRLMRGDEEGARETLSNYRDILGQDHFFVEIQDHGIPEQHKTNPWLIKTARDMGLRIIGTNDCHYLEHEDWEHHDALLCQPAGTLIKKVIPPEKRNIPRGTSGHFQHIDVPIEDLQIGDLVATWNGSSRRGRFVHSGSRITEVGSREYDGDLVQVSTKNGETSSYTHDHICVAGLNNPDLYNKHLVYLMRKGSHFRIGSSTFGVGKSLGFKLRADSQLADDLWILDIFDTRHEAQKEEYWTAFTFGIPRWSFPEVRTKSHLPRTPYYKELWGRIEDLTPRAKKCLEHFGRDIKYPFWSKNPDGEVTFKIGRKNPINIRACNLLDGMLMCSYDRGEVATYQGTGLWSPIELNRSHFNGIVYSIEVDETHTYIADGIVTHNCSQTRSLISDQDRFKFSSDQHYLKTTQEMRHLFADIPEACDNTLWVAEQVEPITIIRKGEYHLPNFPIPEEFEDENDYLRHLVYEGAKKLYPEMDAEVVSRLDYELGVIGSAEMSSYFLVMWDIIQFCERQDIMTGPARGSAAGCCLSYCLGITKIDPLKYNLVFERFYNPDRKGLPDIDLDIDTRYRDHLMNYCADKYGSDHVAQIITFGYIKAKAALKDAARVMGFDFQTGTHLSNAVPPDLFGRSIPLAEVVKPAPSERWKDQWEQGKDMRALLEDSEFRPIIDTALGLEGLVRSTGVHAAAFVIADRPVVEHVPLTKKGKEKPVTTAYSMGDVEAAGLVKMDFLGLENLDIISDTIKLIPDPFFELPTEYDDPAVYALLCRGETTGVFQLESDPMKRLMRQIKPENFDHIAALLALYRPGPMGLGLHEEYAKRKNGESPVAYLHPDAEEILGNTFGIMIYQEQMMSVAGLFAGFDAGERDSLRKATGKKILSEMEAQKDKFIQGCADKNYGSDLGMKWWEIIEPFGSYGFNAAHSYGYGVISYWTSYLKVHYPVEYMSAILTAKKDDLDKAGVYLAECAKMGIEVLPPDVNKSGVNFTPDRANIRFGLSAIRGMGNEAAEFIINARETKPYGSYDDFRSRVPGKIINKGKAFGLIAAGAFDDIASRGGLLQQYEDLDAAAKITEKASGAGMQSLTDLMGYDTSVAVEEVELSPERIRELEREYLGISITSNPLIEWSQAMERNGVNSIEEARSYGEDAQVNICAVVTSVKPWTTKKGAKMATIGLQDFTGTMDALIFARTWEKVKPQLDQCIVISGKVSDDGEKILTHDIQILDASHKGSIIASKGQLNIRVTAHELNSVDIDRLQAILNDPWYLGKEEVVIEVQGAQTINLGVKVNARDATLRSDIRTLFRRDVILDL